MGFWDSVLGSDKKTEEKPQGKATSNPFTVSLSFSPLRLSANARSSVNLMVKIKNISNSPQLVSVDALLPRKGMIGFDPACINKAAEKRMGELKPGEVTEAHIPVWSNTQTQQGSFPVEVTVFSHYIGYEKVLSYIKKNTSLRAV